MLRVLYILFAVLMISGNAYCLEFSSLSKYKPVQMSYTTKSKTFASFLLKLHPEATLKTDLFLKVVYIIATDTLYDFIYTDGNYDGVLKQIQLDAGETVTVMLYLHNAQVEIVNGVNGVLEMRKDEEADEVSSEAKFAFAGTIWKVDDSPIFRINKSNTEMKNLILKINLSENYEYDKLYVRVKVISPMQGILELSRTTEIHTEEYLPYKSKFVEIEFPELHVDKPGNYYVQVSHEHSAKRLNGVSSIAWELR